LFRSLSKSSSLFATILITERGARTIGTRTPILVEAKVNTRWLLDFRWRPAGVVGYNVQAAVDTEQHLIIAHEVTNSVSDRAGLRIAIRIATKISSVLKLCFAPGDLPPDLPTCYCALRVGTTLRQVRQAVACPRAPVKRESTEYSRLSPWAPLVPSVGTIVLKI
jgi:hypothetical protein